jgi:NAD(P)-dependent dehydrogenase (short-subunit alcohol dehydrogenase family)
VVAGGEAECVAIDVARREDVAMPVARSQERVGRLDVLTDNAGVMPIGTLDDLAVRPLEYGQSQHQWRRLGKCPGAAGVSRAIATGARRWRSSVTSP